MENLRFDAASQLKDYLKPYPRIGKGTEGRVFLIDNKWVLKIDNSFFRDIIFPIWKENEVLRFRDVEIDGFSFVKYLAYVGNEIVGLMSPYIKGSDINESLLANKIIGNVINASARLVSSIEELSYLGIKIRDVWAKNIIYGDSKLSVIDTNRFKYMEDMNLFLINMRGIMPSVIMSTLGCFARGEYFDDNLSILKFLDLTESRFKDFESDLCLLQNPEELLLGIKEELEEFLQMRVDKFSDVKEPLKRVLRKQERVATGMSI